MPDPVWITGSARSGKTARLIEHLSAGLEVSVEAARVSGGARATEVTRSRVVPLRQQRNRQQTAGVLVFAANGDNRLELTDRITTVTRGDYAVHSTTPLGFFQDEVVLFFPLLIEQLNLNARFPLRLHTENEQEMASQLWRSQLGQAVGQLSEAGEARLVRRTLDLLQLAALGGFSVAEIPAILEQGLVVPEEPLDGRLTDFPLAPVLVGELLTQWQTWCLERGFLTYGIMAGLYGQHLLANPAYQEHLRRRYCLVLADDVDDYPAIARHLFEVFLNQGVTSVFTYNPDGAVRLGLGADPTYLAGLADRCQCEMLSQRPVPCLGDVVAPSIVELVMSPVFFAGLPESIQAIQTTSRAQLLRQTGETIVEAVQTGQVEPREIAVIAPGMDAIARYTLTEILAKHQIAVEALNDQRPLASAPTIRALLTLLTLVYPGLGRLVNRDAVAEMLVVLSKRQPSSSDVPGQAMDSSLLPSAFAIDPVRAGLLADHCFEPHLDRPRLLPSTAFPRWDRLGYQATSAYEEIVRWIETQKVQQEQRLIPSPVSLIDRAIQQFLWNGSYLSFEQLAAVRELIETAQHYWEVDTRLQQSKRQGLNQSPSSQSETVANFIQLLRGGTVTSNPFPVRAIGPTSNAVVLSNVFQYRSSRRTHRWQFWLDAGSPRWLTGVDALFGYQLFLQNWSGRPITADEVMTANEQRLRRILLDLLGRTGERLFLCHSDLATNGQEQMGILLALVNAAVPLHAEGMLTEASASF